MVCNVGDLAAFDATRTQPKHLFSEFSPGFGAIKVFPGRVEFFPDLAQFSVSEI